MHGRHLFHGEDGSRRVLPARRCEVLVGWPRTRGHDDGHNNDDDYPSQVEDGHACSNASARTAASSGTASSADTNDRADGRPLGTERNREVPRRITELFAAALRRMLASRRRRGVVQIAG